MGRSIIGRRTITENLSPVPPSTPVLLVRPVPFTPNPPIPPLRRFLAVNSLLIPNRPRSEWKDEKLRESNGWPETGPALHIISSSGHKPTRRWQLGECV
jgi:hypothetical protein